MGLDTSARSAFVGAVAAVTVALPFNCADAQSRAAPAGTKPGVSSDLVSDPKAGMGNPELPAYGRAAEISKRNASLVVVVLKGDRSASGLSADNIGNAIRDYVRTKHRVNATVLAQIVPGSDGLAISYFVNGQKIKTYGLRDGMSPRHISEAVGIYNLSVVAGNPDRD